jgi:TusA-related sulfurtransferase
MTDKNLIQLDIRGQICPSCLLLTLKQLNEHGAAVRSGQTEIVVFTDDRQAIGTIPGAVDKMGYQTDVARQDGLYRIRIYQQK